MKSWVVALLGVLAGMFVAVAVILFFGGKTEAVKQNVAAVLKPETKKELTGYGYLRGGSHYALKNKYAAFVSKVHVYADTRVKKGDCILEYDDYDLRVKITEVENDIAAMKKDIELQETKLELVRLDPLPSDYRNINWKSARAKELMERTENEWQVYRRLSRNRSVSDLDLRSKKQAYLDAKAAYQITVSDQEKVNNGLKKLYLQQAEQQLALLKTKLAGLERELELLNEQRKYYKIVAPHDGIINTHSDTVGAWNAAATEAACLHRDHRFYVYAYFPEEDIINIKSGMDAKVFSHDDGEWYDAKIFELTRSRTGVGDGIFHLVKMRITSDLTGKIKRPGKIQVEGAVTVKIPL
jgi:multidrug resistance efflux pump